MPCGGIPRFGQVLFPHKKIDFLLSVVTVVTIVNVVNVVNVVTTRKDACLIKGMFFDGITSRLEKTRKAFMKQGAKKELKQLSPEAIILTLALTLI